jgi:NitT/TauT family transport system permease protein
VIASLLRKCGPVLIVLLLWQYAVVQYGFGDGFIPAPTEVITATYEWIFGPEGRYSGTWAASFVDSAIRVLTGFTCALIIGVPLGIMIGRSKVLADLIDPLLQVLRPVPTASWIPFCLIFFGIGTGAAIALVTIGSFFPILLNTTAGARNVSKLHIRSAQMLGLNRFQMIYRVVLPSALPSILVGARIAMGLSWMLVVISEMVAVKTGVGYELWDAYYYNRMDVVVAAMVIVGVAGFISDYILQRLAKRYLFWSTEQGK